MEKTNAALLLKRSILVLEKRHIEEELLLKQQFLSAYESLKPINVLTKVINDMAGPSEIKESLIQTATGLFTGYITRKMLVRSSGNPLLRLAGVFIQYGVTKFVSNHSAAIKEVGLYVIDKLTGVHLNRKN